MSALGQKETSEDVRGNVRFTPNSAPHSLFNWLPSSHHHFTRRRLVIMSQGFQTVHLAARPERRNNHSQQFSVCGGWVDVSNVLAPASTALLCHLTPTSMPSAKSRSVTCSENPRVKLWRTIEIRQCRAAPLLPRQRRKSPPSVLACRLLARLSATGL